MMSHRFLFGFVGSAALLIGCGAGGTDDPDGAPAYMGGPFNSAGASNGAAGAQPVGGAGTTNNPVVNGQGGQSGVTPVGTGGNGPSGGAGAGNNVNPNNPGGAGTGNDNAGGSGQGGTGNVGGGGFVSVPVNGGASAAFVCGGNRAFVDPFAGTIGQVVTAPSPNNPGHSFTEGPVWVAGLGSLFFSDNVDPEKIWSLTSPTSLATVLLNPSHSNGMALDNDNMLLIADQDGNKIVRVDPSNGAILGDVVPAGNYRPNDLIRRSDGNLYFTDPNSGGRGFYRVSPGGVLSGPFTRTNAPNAPNSPNGIVLSTDENTLFVGDVNESFISSFQLNADGAVDAASGVIFAEGLNGVVDGMAVDCGGNLYVGTGQGVQVLEGSSGEELGTLMEGQYVSNCTFGGADRNTLYATSQGVIRSVVLSVRGLPN